EELDNLSENEIKRRLDEIIRQPFDLERAPLWRIRAFSTGPQRSILLLVFHHLLLDGHSLGLLLEDLERYYNAARSGEKVPARTPRRMFTEYVELEEGYLSSETFQRDRAYWLNQFPDGFDFLELPRGSGANGSTGAEGNVFQSIIPQALVSSLDHLAAAERTTLQTVFLAAFQATLALIGRTSEVVTGIATDVRMSAEFE